VRKCVYRRTGAVAVGADALGPTFAIVPSLEIDRVPSSIIPVGVSIVPAMLQSPAEALMIVIKKTLSIANAGEKIRITVSLKNDSKNVFKNVFAQLFYLTKASALKSNLCLFLQGTPRPPQRSFVEA
jgi:hypothetical protein